MKSFKSLINEVAEPKAEGEKDFKEKHIVAKIDDTRADEKTFKGGTKKDTTKKASYSKGEDEEVYENTALHYANMLREKRDERLDEEFKSGAKVKVKNPHEDRNGQSGTVQKVKNGAQTVKFKDGKIESFADDELVAESVELELRDGSIVEMTIEEMDMINSLSEQLEPLNRGLMEDTMMEDIDGFEDIKAFAAEIV